MPGGWSPIQDRTAARAVERLSSALPRLAPGFGVSVSRQPEKVALPSVGKAFCVALRRLPDTYALRLPVSSGFAVTAHMRSYDSPRVPVKLRSSASYHRGSAPFCPHTAQPVGSIDRKSLRAELYSIRSRLAGVQKARSPGPKLFRPPKPHVRALRYVDARDHSQCVALSFLEA